MRVALVILAAGAASRMRGGDKLLEDVGGMPLVRRLALAGIEAGLPVYVTLSKAYPRRAEALAGLAISQVNVADATEGMSASIRAGIQALSDDVTAAQILPGDMPEITAAALRQIAEAHTATPEEVLRGATASGQPGHPVLFPRRFFPRLKEITGDMGARDIVVAETPRLVSLPGNAALTDLDTPEAWVDWRLKSAL